MRYKTSGVCAQFIDYDIIDGCVRNVKFFGGCNGNGKGVAALLEGMPVAEAIERMSGIDCGGRGTSCPDQLARALRENMG